MAEKAAPAALDMRIDLFQMVSRIAGLDCAAPVLTAEARVPAQSSIFEGHFPGHPLMPGVLLAEFMAQSCGFLLLALNDCSKMPFLAALKDINFRSFVAPGTLLSCRARQEHAGSGYAVMTATVSRAGESKPVCDGRLTFRILPFPDPSLRAHMLQRATDVGLRSKAASTVLARETAT